MGFNVACSGPRNTFNYGYQSHDQTHSVIKTWINTSLYQTDSPVGQLMSCSTRGRRVTIPEPRGRKSLRRRRKRRGRREAYKLSAETDGSVTEASNRWRQENKFHYVILYCIVLYYRVRVVSLHFIVICLMWVIHSISRNTVMTFSLCVCVYLESCSVWFPCSQHKRKHTHTHSHTLLLLSCIASSTLPSHVTNNNQIT